MATFGFDEPEAEIKVTLDGKEQVLVVGGQTYGSKDRYVRPRRSGVPGRRTRPLRPLQFATSRLVERALFPGSAKDTDKIEVRFTDGTAEVFEQHNADDPAKAFWARPGDESTADETAGTLDRQAVPPEAAGVRGRGRRHRRAGAGLQLRDPQRRRGPHDRAVPGGHRRGEGRVLRTQHVQPLVGQHSPRPWRATWSTIWDSLRAE